MNEILAVDDISPTAVTGGVYDFVLAASGHESRASFVSMQLDPARVSRVGLLGFDSFMADGARSTNDEHFASKWSTEPIVTGSRDDQRIYELLDQAFESAT